MNFSKRNKSVVDFMFIIALFGTFIITGLVVVLFGAKVYRSTVARMDANYASRTALSYVTEKIRSHDFADGVDVTDSPATHEGTTLLLKDKVNDKCYVTYLYVRDGVLKEFTVSEDYDFKYDQGTDILEVKEFVASKEGDSLYRFEITDSYNNATKFYVSLYSGTDGEE